MPEEIELKLSAPADVLPAVRAHPAVAAIARKRGWLVEDWSKAPGGPRPILPLGTMLSERERKRTFNGKTLTRGRT